MIGWRRWGVVATLCGAVLLTGGCFSTRHTVGDGPRGGEVRVHHTWYALWGFVPINRVDSRLLVGPADHYRATTSFRGVDVLINLFTGWFGFFRDSLLLEK